MKELGRKPGLGIGLATFLFMGIVLTACRISHESSPRFAGDSGIGLGRASTNTLATHVIESGARLRVGELLGITFADVPTPIPSFEGRIKDDGKITLIQNQSFVAAGKTISELEKEIHDRYVPDYFRNLTVTIRVEGRFFYVDGQVRNPSRQPYLGDITVLGAIAAASGPTDFAKLTKVRILRAAGKVDIVNYKKAKEYPKLDLPIYPGDRIYVPRKFW